MFILTSRTFQKEQTPEQVEERNLEDCMTDFSLRNATLTHSQK